MASNAAQHEIGHLVEWQGQRGVVRYVGNPEFAQGTWIGVELEAAAGKNDGSVKGVRYFECELRHGIFVKPEGVKPIRQSDPPANGRPNASLAKRSSHQSANGIAHGGPSAVLGKRQSVSATSSTVGSRPTSGSRPVRSPPKSPTRLGAPSSSVNGPTSRSGPPPSRSAQHRPSVSSRPSTGPSFARPTAPRATRPSMAARPDSSKTSSVTNNKTKTGSRLSLKPSSQPNRRRHGSCSSCSAASNSSSSASQKGTRGPISRISPSGSIPNHASRDGLSPGLTRSSAASNALSTTAVSTSAAASSPTITSRPTMSTIASSREVEVLRTKVQILGDKRKDDRDKLKALERIQTERDNLELAVQKLQAICKLQQEEMEKLRKQLKEVTEKAERIEREHEEHEVMVEMATLDREMAEETAEVLKTELDALRLKTEELELEVEVLKEENQTLSEEMSPEEKANQGWVHLEKSNERLREALVRLRDMSQEQEAQLKGEVKSLEKDVEELSGVKEQYEAATEKLKLSETTNEELRQQLETALAAEEMIEELTEKNMNLSEKIDQLKATVEDLESLKELSDELELNHLETEKQLQEEIDFKEALLTEQARFVAQQEQSIEEYGYTVSRFRDLVTTLQSDLQDMRASQQITETEAEELTSRSRAMMDLNMKLQVSASKAQVKTIDLELRRLDAQEAAEHLAIVQLFVPDAFQVERDSVLALLRFRRVGAKAQLLHGIVKERITDQTAPTRNDDIFAAYDVLDKLVWVSAMCNRFVNSISSCSVEDFMKYEEALYEMEPVERALNGWVDGLRRDELNEKQCAAQLQRSIALMSHLAEIHVKKGLEVFANHAHMRALVTQSYLENISSAMSRTKDLLQQMMPPSSEKEELAQCILKRMEIIIVNSRSAKVIAGKIVRALEELKTRSLSLPTKTSSSFGFCEHDAEWLAAYSRRVGIAAFAFLNDEGVQEPFNYAQIRDVFLNTTLNWFGAEEDEPFSVFDQRIRSLSTSLGELSNLASDLSVTVEFERPPAPWVVRARELQAANHIPEDVEQQISKLRDNLHERNTQISLLDQELEESAVKIEYLEARMRDTTAKASRITELEIALEDAQKRGEELSASLEDKKQELQAIIKEHTKWRQIAESRRTGSQAAHNDKGHGTGEQTALTADALKRFNTELNSLQGAVRQLRTDNNRLRVRVVKEPASWLQQSPAKSVARPQNPSILNKIECHTTYNRHKLAQVESHGTVNELLFLTRDGGTYDMKGYPHQLTWKPSKTSPDWWTLKRTQQFGTWDVWNDDAVEKCRSLDGFEVPSRRVKQILRRRRGTRTILESDGWSVSTEHALVPQGAEPNIGTASWETELLA